MKATQMTDLLGGPAVEAELEEHASNQSLLNVHSPAYTDQNNSCNDELIFVSNRTYSKMVLRKQFHGEAMSAATVCPG